MSVSWVLVTISVVIEICILLRRRKCRIASAECSGRDKVISPRLTMIIFGSGVLLLGCIMVWGVRESREQDRAFENIAIDVGLRIAGEHMKGSARDLEFSYERVASGGLVFSAQHKLEEKRMRLLIEDKPFCIRVHR